MNNYNNINYTFGVNYAWNGYYFMPVVCAYPIPMAIPLPIQLPDPQYLPIFEEVAPEPLSIPEERSLDKREISADSTVSCPKRLKLADETPAESDLNGQDSTRKNWNSRQIEVLLEECRKVEGDSFKGTKGLNIAILKKIADKVNSFALSPSQFHTTEACRSKVADLKRNEELKAALDPEGKLNDKERRALSRKPFNEEEMRILADSLASGKSISHIALELKRSQKTCYKAISLLNSKKALNYPGDNRNICQLIEGVHEDFSLTNPDPDPAYGKKRQWNDRQIEVLVEEYNKIEGKPSARFKEISEKVNKLASIPIECHTVQACKNKILSLKKKGRLKSAVDS